MIKNLNLKDKIKKNWLLIIMTLSFFITLLNYFEVKSENERLKNQSSNNNDIIENSENESSNYRDENIELNEVDENIIEENENLQIQNEEN